LMSVQLEPLPKNSHPRTITIKKMALISRLDSAELYQTSRSVVLAVLPKKYRTPREKSQWLF
jgi:hypothetical protein